MPQPEASIPFGVALRQHRLAVGLSLDDLARQLHYSKGHLSKVETGRRGPSQDLARRCDAILHARGALTALAPVAAAGKISESAAAVHDGWTISVDHSGQGGFGAVTQRASCGVSTVSPLSWTMPPSVKVSGRAGLHVFRAMFDQLRRAGHAMPPASLLPVGITQTHALRLVASAATAPVRTEALVLASRFAEYTGWLAQEADDDQGALWWTSRAVEFAAAGGDRELAAYALVRRGLVALCRYDARETIAVAKRAQTLPCGARVRGLAALREAQGHALAGDYSRCRRLLDRGSALLASADATDHQRPVLGSTTISDPVALVTGWCLHDLGRPREAMDPLQSALATVPTFADRTRARVGVRHSLALVAAGELEQGATALEQVLEAVAPVDSATVRVDLRRMAQELSRWRSHRLVKDLMPRLLNALNSNYR